MQRSLFSFFFGMMTLAAVAAVAGKRIEAALFALGFISAAILTAAALSSARRLRSAAGVLNHLANLIDAGKPARAPSAKPAIVDQREDDLVSALMNLGSRKGQAKTAARYAIAQADPAANLADLVKVALRAPEVAA